jgi:hypothetical protein
LTLEIHAGPNVKCPIFWSVLTNIITSQHITAQHQQQPFSSSPALADIVKLTDAFLEPFIVNASKRTLTFSFLTFTQLRPDLSCMYTTGTVHSWSAETHSCGDTYSELKTQCPVDVVPADYAE